MLVGQVLKHRGLRGAMLLAPSMLLLLMSVPDARLMAQIAAPRTLQASEVFERLRFIKSYTDLGLPAVHNVEGEQVFREQVLAADVISFQPGSRLVFSGSGAERNEIYIIAREIRLPREGAGATPSITWDRDVSVTRVVPSPGKAQSGPPGPVDGAGGSAGTDGYPGNPGYPGRSAPTLFIFVSSVVGGRVQVDLQGQDGGPGSEGQAGGDGGSGRTGRNGVSSLFECRSGGGNGGNGGAGGAGGVGGAGGRGGNGGTLVLVSSEQQLASAMRLFSVDVRGGRGGAGGAGGPGGLGGQPGGGGSGSGFCQGGQPGARGADGGSGKPGEDGVGGIAGDYATSVMTATQMRSLRLLQ